MWSHKYIRSTIFDIFCPVAASIDTEEGLIRFDVKAHAIKIYSSKCSNKTFLLKDEKNVLQSTYRPSPFPR
jgi:hypothetical protein